MSRPRPGPRLMHQRVCGSGPAEVVGTGRRPVGSDQGNLLIKWEYRAKNASVSALEGHFDAEKQGFKRRTCNATVVHLGSPVRGFAIGPIRTPRRIGPNPPESMERGPEAYHGLFGRKNGPLRPSGVTKSTRYCFKSMTCFGPTPAAHLGVGRAAHSHRSVQVAARPMASLLCLRIVDATAGDDIPY